MCWRVLQATTSSHALGGRVALETSALGIWDVVFPNNYLCRGEVERIVTKEETNPLAGFCGPAYKTPAPCLSETWMCHKHNPGLCFCACGICCDIQLSCKKCAPESRVSFLCITHIFSHDGYENKLLKAGTKCKFLSCWVCRQPGKEL